MDFSTQQGSLQYKKMRNYVIGMIDL